eukprot:1066870-Prorocentrum_minimum.AAC.4
MQPELAAEAAKNKMAVFFDCETLKVTPLTFDPMRSTSYKYTYNLGPRYESQRASQCLEQLMDDTARPVARDARVRAHTRVPKAVRFGFADEDAERHLEDFHPTVVDMGAV